MTLTCKNHPNLRWNCKDIAWNTPTEEHPNGKYNGQRGLHYLGTKDYEFVAECTCSVNDLIPVK